MKKSEINMNKHKIKMGRDKMYITCFVRFVTKINTKVSYICYNYTRTIMQQKQLILLVAICIGFVTMSFGQKGNYRIQNGVGIYGGITQYVILTDNFTTKKGN